MTTAEHKKQEQYPLLKPNGPFVINTGNVQEASGMDGMPTSSRCYFPRRWILMLLISFGGMVSYSLRINTSITVIPMTDAYGWSSKQQGLVLSSLFFTYATTQLLWGWLARHFRAAKLVAGVGLFLAVLLSTLLPSAAPVFPVIILTRIMIGLAEAPFFPAVAQMLSAWIPPAEMATAATVSYNGTMLGTVTVFFCTPVIIKYLSWETSFYIYSILGFAWAVLWFALTTETPAECKFLFWEERHYIMSRLDKANANAATGDSSVPWRALLTCRAMWAACGMAFSAGWGFYLLLSWAPTYLHRVHHMSLTSIGLAETVAYAASYLCSVVVALLSDRMLAHGWSKPFVRKLFPCVAFSACAASLGYLGFSAHITPRSATLCIATCIVAQGMAMPGTATAPLDISSRLSGVVQGFVNTAAQLPGLFAVYITGLLLPHWTVIWALAVGFYATAALVYLFLYSPEKVLE